MSEHHCPTCSRKFNPADSSAMPFCSERCRLIDLGRWLDEGFSVPRVAEDPIDEAEGPVGVRVEE